MVNSYLVSSIYFIPPTIPIQKEYLTNMGQWFLLGCNTIFPS